jgi:RNA polymerase sigma-70 factor (ECF subfamily)
VTPQRAFEQHHQAVFSFAWRLTGRQEVAEDLTQECFLALLRAPRRFDEARGSMKTFLFAITRNLALKHYRDHGMEEALDCPDAPATGDSQAARDVSSAVAAAVAALPQLQQEALILFEYEGLTLEEVAQVVGADAGAVKSRLHRARKRLRQVLAPYRKTEKAHGTA